MAGKKELFETIRRSKRLSSKSVRAMRDFYRERIRSFPTAEEYVSRLGLDPAIVSELTDQPVRIRTGNKGLLHSTLDFTFSDKDQLQLPLLFDERANNSFRHSQKSFGCRLVTLSNKNLSLNEMIQENFNIPLELFTNNLALPDSSVVSLSIFFHELAHTHSLQDNFNAGMSEIDADLRSLELLADIQKDPDLPRIFTMYRALELESYTYNCIPLYLDAYFDDYPLPSQDDMIGAMVDLRMAAEKLFDKYDSAETKYKKILLPVENWDYLEISSAIEIFSCMKIQKIDLPFYAQRRLDLFLESAQFFLEPLYEKIQAHIQKNLLNYDYPRLTI